MRRGARILAFSLFVTGAAGCAVQDIYSGSTGSPYSSPDPYHYRCNASCQRAGG